ncbi:MAG: glycosyltransferase [Chloroflexota bacterium]
MSKRIAMISYHTCPLASIEGKETGGMNVYVLELSRQLALLGYQVDMFTRKHDPDSPRVVEVGQNLRLMHLPSGPPHTPKKQLIRHLDEFVAEFQAFSEQENISYDLFHCHYYLSGIVGLKINDGYRIPRPIALTFHTLALMKNLVARSEGEQETQERIKAEFLLAQQADKIIVPSESAKNYLELLYEGPPSRIMVVPPGFNGDLFKPIDPKISKEKIGAEHDHRVIMFVGRIEPLKGVDVLMYATKILRQKHPDWPICLWILGGDISQQMSQWSDELQKLERLRKILNMRTSVKFVGQKPQDELPYYLNSAEVVVMPSNYESFGMAALESMACGVPVITTNVSGISSFLDEAQKALVTSAHNPLLLASHIETLLEDEAMHAKLGRDIHAKVQDLSWTRIAEKIAAVYETL